MLNGSTGALLGSIGIGGSPTSVFYDEANGHVYATDVTHNNVTAINPSTDLVLHSRTVGSAPDGIALDPVNGYVYVSDGSSHNVTILNGNSNDAVVGSIQVGTEPMGMAFDPNNQELYICNRGSANVTVLNASTDLITTTISVNAYPFDVAFDAANHDFYMVNQGAFPFTTPQQTTIINGTSNTIQGQVPGGLVDPILVAFDSTNGDVYVAPSYTGNLSEISGSRNVAIASIPLATNPYAVGYNGADNQLLVTDSDSSRLFAVSDASTRVTASVPVGLARTGSSLSPRTERPTSRTTNLGT